MNVVYGIVIALTVIVALLLIGIVLIQKSKGGGLSSQFGGAASTMGVQQTNVFLEKGTWYLAAILVLLSIVSVYTMPKSSSAAAIRSEQQKEAPVTPASNQFATPAVPDAVPVAVPAEEPVATEQGAE